MLLQEAQSEITGARHLAITTLCSASLLLLVGAVPLALFTKQGLVAWSHGEWGWPDTSYLAFIVLLSASLLVHAAQDEDAMFPRTIALIAAVLLVPAGFVSWILMLAAHAGADSLGLASRWVAANSEFALSVLPFAMSITAGLLMRRFDHRSRRFRVATIGGVVGVTAVVFGLAVMIAHFGA